MSSKNEPHQLERHIWCPRARNKVSSPPHHNWKLETEVSQWWSLTVRQRAENVHTRCCGYAFPFNPNFLEHSKAHLISGDPGSTTACLFICERF